LRKQGEAYLNLFQYDQAAKAFLSAEKLADNQDRAEAAKLYVQLGIVYDLTNQPDKATEYYLRGMKLDSANSYMALEPLRNMVSSLAYNAKCQYNGAAILQLRMIAICGADKSLPNNLGFEYLELGRLYRQMHSWDKAKNALHQAIVEAEKNSPS